MPRPIAAAVAAIACIVAPAADACLCPWIQTPAEAEAAGRRALVAADLIVDATVGDTSWLHRAICRDRTWPARLIGFGQSVSADRPITIHRVVKGRAERSPTLIGNETRVETAGCVVTTSSCDPTILSNHRTILVLHREPDGRYRALIGCEVRAIRNSRAGQALFNRAGINPSAL